MKTRIKLAVAIATTMALIAACSGDDDDDTTSAVGETGETGEDSSFEVAIAMSAEFESLDPSLSSTIDESFGHGNISETLIDIVDGELVPKLATSWELVDDHTWSFSLREDVSFTNGEPFDAEAAVFSIEYLLDPNREGISNKASYFANYAGAEVVDDHIIEISGTDPWADLPRLMAVPVMYPPEHMAEGGPNAYEDEPIGTGPYVLESSSGGEYVLTRNPDYWDDISDAPDQVTYVVRTEASARVSALLAGEADIVSAVPVQLVERVPTVVSAPGIAAISLMLNGLRAPTDDPRVREAITLAVDSEGIREAVRGEFADTVQCQYVNDAATGFNSDLEPQEYDPDRARDLVEETGLGDQPIRFIVRAGQEGDGEQAAAIVTEQLREVGIDVTFETLSREEFVAEISGEDQTARPHIAMSAPSADSGTVFQPWSVWINEGGRLTVFPQSEYPDFTPTIEGLSATVDEDERSELFDTASEMICDSNAVVFMYLPQVLYGAREGLSFNARSDGRIFVQTVEQG